MSKQTRWLDAESRRWAAENIITAEQAERIRGLYALPANALSWGLIVFFGLGAVIIGLGVILLIAYNWDKIPKPGKLAIVFATLLATQASGLALRRHTDWREQLGEALSLLGTMAFGAGIWLVAQIYNIDEHYPNGFLLWALGALAMAWVLPSVPQAITAVVLLAIWGGTEAIAFDTPVDISALIVLVAVGPLAWRRRSAPLAVFTVAGLYWLLLCGAGHWGGASGAFTNALALSAALLAAAKLMTETAGVSSIRGVMRFFGGLGFVVCAYVLSFHGAVEDMLVWSSRVDGMAMMAIYHWLLFAIAATGWIWLLVRMLRDGSSEVRTEEWLFPIALVYALVMGAWGDTTEPALIATVFNLVCLALASAWMVRGCRNTDLGLVVPGSVLLGLVVFARYFDLFNSLATRGLIFVLFGAVLFAEGFYYRRIRNSAGTERSQS